MIFLKLLSLVVLFLIGSFFQMLANTLILDDGLNLPIYVNLIVAAFIWSKCVMSFPQMLRWLSRGFSVDISYWEQTRNELKVVGLAIIVFGLISLGNLITFLIYNTPAFMQTWPDWVFITLGFVSFLLVFGLSSALEKSIADFLGIGYPNALREEQEEQEAQQEAQQEAPETEVQKEASQEDRGGN